MPFDAQISRPMQQTPMPIGDALSRLEYQEGRIKQLEAALAQTGHTQASDPVQRLRTSKLPLSPESILGASEQIGGTVTDREALLLRGRAFKTQYDGTTHPGALITHIPELHILSLIHI